jgi:hypothetical protein
MSTGVIWLTINIEILTKWNMAVFTGLLAQINEGHESI